MTFHEFYHTHVKHFVFDVELENCPTHMQLRYQRMFSLDADKEMFDCLSQAETRTEG